MYFPLFDENHEGQMMLKEERQVAQNFIDAPFWHELRYLCSGTSYTWKASRISYDTYDGKYAFSVLISPLYT